MIISSSSRGLNLLFASTSAGANRSYYGSSYTSIISSSSTSTLTIISYFNILLRISKLLLLPGLFLTLTITLTLTLSLSLSLSLTLTLILTLDYC